MTTYELRTSDIHPKTVGDPNLGANENYAEPVVAPRKMNRVSSTSFQNNGADLATVGQRLTMLRMTLGLTQEQVASKVVICFKSGDSEGIPHPMSRNAYCMYELDSVPPSLKTTEDLAKALGVSPAWLAFVFDLKRQQLIKAVRKIFRKILNIKPAPPSILCIGLKETYKAISDDRQLTGRGGLPYKLIEPYNWNGADGREAFLLCGVIDKALPFECRSGLHAAGMAERLYFVTEGSIGRLKDFLFNAGSIAINDDAPSIEIEHLRRAYDEQKKPGIAFNAFIDDLSQAPKSEGDKESPLRKRTTNQLMSKKPDKND